MYVATCCPLSRTLTVAVHHLPKMPASSMSQDEIDACRLAFEKFDADGSGTIEPNELKSVLVRFTTF